MFTKMNRLAILLFVCGILCCCIIGLNAHFLTLDHFWTNQFLEGTEAEVTCNITDGQLFKKVTTYNADGTVNSTYWTPDPKTPKIEIQSIAHGLGWSQIQFSGNIAGDPKGNAKDWDKARKVGLWIFPPSPSFYAHDKKVYKELSGTFKRAEGAYSWDGDGTIKYTPVYFKVRPSFSGKRLGISGTWENGEVWTTSADKSGGWKVKYYSKHLGSDSNDDDDDENNDGNNGGNNGNNDGNDGNNGGNNDDVTIIGGDDTKPLTPLTPPPTVPDSPSNFTATPGRIAIKLLWDAPSSDGGSPITDYQYQYKRKQTATSWTAWSNWTSAGTSEFAWITGLRANRRYWVRIRALNSIGASSNTGTIVDTRK